MPLNFSTSLRGFRATCSSSCCRQRSGKVGDEQFVVVLEVAIVVVADQVQKVELVYNHLEGGVGTVPHRHQVHKGHVIEK